MIVKVKTHPKTDGWRFFEADHVQYCTDKREKFEKQVVIDEVQQFEFFDTVASKDPTYLKAAFISFRSGSDPVQIITNLPAFLVNDNGVTVERLF